MKPSGARKTPNWLWLVLATLAVSAVFGTTIGYFIETLPPADPPHPLIFGRLVVDAVAFTIMISLLFAVAIPATRYWDPRITSWEALIGLTTLLVVGPVTLAALEHTVAKRGDSWAEAVAFGLAMASYMLARWLYRRRWPPDAAAGQRTDAVRKRGD